MFRFNAGSRVGTITLIPVIQVFSADNRRKVGYYKNPYANTGTMTIVLNN